jgi:UDP-glucose 4-epimerase
VKLLVTGGAGYIGSIVTAQLLQAGHQVTVLDDLSTGHADAVPDGASLIEGSLLDETRLAASKLAVDLMIGTYAEAFGT